MMNELTGRPGPAGPPGGRRGRLNLGLSLLSPSFQISIVA